MPNRILREKIIKSEMVNKLGWPAEVFYRRLMSVVDDFGRYDARPSLLRTDLFGLRIDRVPESDIVKWMNECSEAGLVRLYSVENKPYLELLQFNQTIRVKKSKYPSPPGNDSTCNADATQMNSTCMSGGRKKEEGKGFGVGDGLQNPPPPYTGTNYSSVEILNNEENMIRCLADEYFKLRNFQMGVTDPDRVEILTKCFVDYRNGVSKTHSNQQDFRTHYFNWLPKHLSKNNKSNDQNQTGLSAAAQRLKDAAAKARS